MKILIDMNLSPKFMDVLINNGIDTTHWTKIGAPNAKDTEVMEYASNNNCIIMTCDLDFNVILSITHDLKPSVVLIRAQRINAEQDGGWIAALLKENADALDKGAILVVDYKKFRLRLLPL
jgi:predicted nuclease of predicted toxin-antitoxin system